MKWYLIEFITSWGHPTRWEIYGAGDRAKVSENLVRCLVPQYAKIIEELPSR